MVDLADTLQRACRSGDTVLLRKTLDSSKGDIVNTLDPKLGWSPLFRAAICGHVDAARMLLTSGADPNLRNKAGEVPLHPAADSGNAKLAQLLLEKDADPNLISNGDL